MSIAPPRILSHTYEIHPTIRQQLERLGNDSKAPTKRATNNVCRASGELAESMPRKAFEGSWQCLRASRLHVAEAIGPILVRYPLAKCADQKAKEALEGFLRFGKLM